MSDLDLERLKAYALTPTDSCDRAFAYLKEGVLALLAERSSLIERVQQAEAKADEAIRLYLHHEAVRREAEAREKASRIEGIREGFEIAEDEIIGWGEGGSWKDAREARDTRIRELEGEGKT